MPSKGRDTRQSSEQHDSQPADPITPTGIECHDLAKPCNTRHQQRCSLRVLPRSIEITAQTGRSLLMRVMSAIGRSGDLG